MVVVALLTACGASEAARSPFCEHLADAGAVVLTDPEAVSWWGRAVELAPTEIRDDVAVFERAAVLLADDDDLTVGAAVEQVFVTRRRAADARLDAYVADACGFPIRSLERDAA